MDRGIKRWMVGALQCMAAASPVPASPVSYQDPGPGAFDIMVGPNSGDLKAALLHIGG